MVLQVFQGLVAVIGLDDLKALSRKININSFNNLFIVIAYKNRLHKFPPLKFYPGKNTFTTSSIT